MSFKVRELYYYAVCFITLMMCIFAVVQLVDSVADVAYPNPHYTPSKIDMYRMQERTNSENIVDEATLEQWIEEERDQQLMRETQARKHRFVKDLARSLAFLAIAIPVYIYHWRRVRNFES